MSQIKDGTYVELNAALQRQSSIVCLVEDPMIYIRTKSLRHSHNTPAAIPHLWSCSWFINQQHATIFPSPFPCSLVLSLTPRSLSLFLFLVPCSLFLLLPLTYFNLYLSPLFSLLLLLFLMGNHQLRGVTSGAIQALTPASHEMDCPPPLKTLCLHTCIYFSHSQIYICICDCLQP